VKALINFRSRAGVALLDKQMGHALHIMVLLQGDYVPLRARARAACVAFSNNPPRSLQKN
jgi:hypothetical protein